MNLKKAQELADSKLGLRCKHKGEEVLTYANAWTLTVDIYKWLKIKFI